MKYIVFDVFLISFSFFPEKFKRQIEIKKIVVLKVVWCVRVCVRACLRACVRACVPACRRAWHIYLAELSQFKLLVKILGRYVETHNIISFSSQFRGI